MTHKGFLKRTMAMVLAASMLFGEGNGLVSERLLGTVSVKADDLSSQKENEIISLDYFNAADATMQKSAVGATSYGFVMPKFNGKDSKDLCLSDVEKDLELQVDVDGNWKSINDVDYFKFNSTWGWEYQVWSADASGWICWFKIDKTTNLRFHSISHPDVNLEYHLILNPLPTYAITSIMAKNPNLDSNATGGAAIDWSQMEFNGDAAITYAQVKDDIELYVDNHDGKGFVKLLSNAESGFIWDSNFGIYEEGNGGIWFKNINWSYTIRVQKKTDASVYADVNIHYTEPDRSNTMLTAFDGKNVFNANDAGENSASVGIVLPRINGSNAVQSDLGKFVYQVCDGATYDSASGTWTGGNWINLSDSENWLYQDSGYNKYSASQQWGYFADTVYGLWFQPVLKDTYFRIGYPEAGSDTVSDNWIYYTIIGNPNGVVPDVADMTPITVDNSGEPSGDVTDVEEPDGWKLIWNDEFNGTSLDTSKWSNQTGYFIDENDYTTAGWGNSELEYYTDSEENTSVSDGKLKLTLKKDKKTFTDTSGRTADALYSSGKIVSQNKFSVKYGRVDFRAKLPDGNGIWPAMWMMPNDDIYGSWACSGEIDVFEGRGRTPEMAYGTLHYGSTWPGDLESGEKINMKTTPQIGSDMTDWHVYSLVWEEGNIKMYVDGICYFKRQADSWSSVGAPNNENAPFDQRFYLIMNLACGGYFDGLVAPDYDTFTDKEMYVDYVRVYQRPLADGETDEKPDDAALEAAGRTDGESSGKTDGLYGDYRVGTVIPATGITLNKNQIIMDAGSEEKLTATITPANATEKNVTWKSSNPDVVTVSGGKLTAVKRGTATITASVGNHTATCKVRVNGTDVRGVLLTPQTLTMTTGDTQTLNATVQPFNASNRKVTWESSDESVANVKDGVVTAVKAGSAVITVRTEDGGYTADCTVTVKGAVVNGVTLNQSELSLKKGTTGKLTATVTPANAQNKKVEWVSSNERVATVATDGTITAENEGEAIITVFTEDGNYTASCVVTVTEAKNDNVKENKGVQKDADGNVIIYVNDVPHTEMVAFYNLYDTQEEALAHLQIASLAGYGMNRQEDGNFVRNLGKLDENKYLVYAFNNGVQETPVAVKVYDIPQLNVQPITAKYTIEYYTQDTDAKGYTCISKEVKTADIDQTVEADVTAPTGFFLNENAMDSKLSGVVAQDGSLILKVFFNRNYYRVIYHADEGVMEKEQDQYLYGLGLRELPTPTKEGYTFGGWYTSESCEAEKLITEISQRQTGDLELYAKWDKVADKEPVKEPDNGTVTVPSNGTDNTAPSKPAEEPKKTYVVKIPSADGKGYVTKEVKEGEIIDKPETPTKKGYKFAGWYVDGKKYNFDQPLDKNAVLKAKWSPIKVTKIKVSGSAKKAKAGDKIKLTATVSPKNAKNCAVTWKSSNSKYATVNAKGVVTVKKAGSGKTITITATAKDGSKTKAKFKITITK